MTDRVISAAPVRALSAIGSAILPKSVTRPRLRASRPSRKSVAEATQNSTNATTRQPVVSAARQTTNSGTSTMRATVNMLATLTRLTGVVVAGPAVLAVLGVGPAAAPCAP